MIPTGTARPIRHDLVSIVSLSHDYSNGQRWQVVTIYEDDHDANARRVLDLRLPMTPKDNIKRAAELEAKISYCDGYNQEKHRWGDDGYRTAWQVELNPVNRAVLADRFPHARQFEDVRECGARNLCAVDVITAGFPCQDISIAGSHAPRGLQGKRSGF